MIAINVPIRGQFPRTIQRVKGVNLHNMILLMQNSILQMTSLIGLNRCDGDSIDDIVHQGTT